MIARAIAQLIKMRAAGPQTRRHLCEGPTDLGPALAEIKRSFDIDLGDVDIAALTTVEELESAVVARAALGSGPRCATAMAFYRLRRALQDAEPASQPAASPRPPDRLAENWRTSPKSLARSLAKSSGLSLSYTSGFLRMSPKFEPSRLAAAMTLVYALSIFLVPLGGVVQSVAVMLIGVALTGGAALIVYLDPAAFRQETTLGELSRDLVDGNVSRLIGEGARIDAERARLAVRRLLAKWLGGPAETIIGATKLYSHPPRRRRA